MAPDNGSADYQRGLRDGRADGIQAGRIEALERRADKFETAQGDHERRLVLLERIAWAMAGILTLSSVYPQLKGLLDALAGK